MHRALQIREIQANIIDFVGYFEHSIYELHADEKEFQEARRNLCAVALTCKALLPYALDCRWRVIHSLVELLRTLPPEIWTTHQRHHPEYRQITTVHVWLCPPFALILLLTSYLESSRTDQRRAPATVQLLCTTSSDLDTTKTLAAAGG